MLSEYKNIFFLGAGGIGMSALARYFVRCGKNVAGFDRTTTRLTSQLEDEGIHVIFSEDKSLLSPEFSDPKKTLVIYTPAVKEDNALMIFFRAQGFEIVKRAEVLGILTRRYRTIAVAGTHGKTSISCMTAHLLWQSSVGCTAILGGIPKNYNTNFLYSKSSVFAVTEADEFDRSFLKLHPYYAVITSADADHLDIYENHESLLEAFSKFAAQINKDGFLLIKHGLHLSLGKMQARTVFTYALDDNKADVYAENIRISESVMKFDLVIPGKKIEGLEMAATGTINIENAVAASFLALKSGIKKQELRSGLKSFAGVQRRFDKQFEGHGTVYIDDYAHHPEEIRALIRSIRAIYPGKSITGIFQPHLYSRTRDFAEGFAESLSKLDRVILLEIYPAREKPIDKVSSDLIFQKISNPEKISINKVALPDYIKENEFEILLTIGAGDIDKLVEPIREILERKAQKIQS